MMLMQHQPQRVPLAYASANYRWCDSFALLMSGSPHVGAPGLNRTIATRLLSDFSDSNHE